MRCITTQNSRTSTAAARAAFSGVWGGGASRMSGVSVFAASPCEVLLQPERCSLGLHSSQQAVPEARVCATKGPVDMNNKKHNTNGKWRWLWKPSTWSWQATWEWLVDWAWKPWAKPLPAWTSLAAIVTVGILAIAT